MAFNVFYAWQSNRPNSVCRRFIRAALDEARSVLESDLEIEESLRNDIVVDQDTQGVAGSPPVAETILEKIRGSNLFVADLTPTHSGPDGRTTPNPNVLIEYGYALRALGHHRIVGVFNEAYGTIQELPFDLQHRRWPICYRLHQDQSSSTRRDQRKTLTRHLANAIRSAIRVSSQNGASHTDSLDQDPFPVFHPVINHFPWNTPLVRPGNNSLISLPAGPTIYLNLHPHQSSLHLTNVEAQKIAYESLRPLAYSRGNGTCIARTRNGPAVFAISNSDPPALLDASLLHRDGSLYGIDCLHLRTGSSDLSTTPFVPSMAVEEILITGLQHFLLVAQHQLKLQPPLEIRVGLEGVDGHRLAVDPTQFSSGYIGPILEQNLDADFTVTSYSVDSFDFLLPFFRTVYDAVGIHRPHVPTVGH